MIGWHAQGIWMRCGVLNAKVPTVGLSGKRLQTSCQRK